MRKAAVSKCLACLGRVNWLRASVLGQNGATVETRQVRAKADRVFWTVLALL